LTVAAGPALILAVWGATRIRAVALATGLTVRLARRRTELQNGERNDRNPKAELAVGADSRRRPHHVLDEQWPS